MVIVSLAVQYSSSKFFPDAAPLLEEERYVRLGALPLDRNYPFGVHGSSASSALAAHDYPIDFTEAEDADVFDERLDRKKSHGWPGLAKMIDAR